MFSSPKNFLIGAAAIAGGALLIAATGGAAAPFLVATGVTGGAIQFGTSAYKAATAKTDDEAKAAWQGMGTGTSAIAGSVIGAKSALKGAGVDTSKMGVLKATTECFRQAPSSLGKSFNAFASGKALTNIQNTFKIQNKAKAERQTEAPDSDLKQTQPDVDDINTRNTAQKPAQSEQGTVEASQRSADKPLDSKSTVKINEQTTQSTQLKDAGNETPAIQKTQQQAPAQASQTNATSLVNKKVTVTTKSGKPVEATIQIKPAKYGEKIVITDAQGNQLGYSNIEIANPNDYSYFPESITNYIKDGAVKVELMETAGARGQYSGIGIQLHKAAVLRSKELGFEGRVILDAAWNSHGFHYKSGFRPLLPGCDCNTIDDTSNAILAAIESAKATGTKVNTKDLGGILMGLSEENIPVLLDK